MSDGDTLTLDEAGGSVTTIDTDDANLGPHTNEELARVCVIENSFEAELLREVLEAERIPCFVQSHREVAFDGLFTLERGWGALYVRESDFEKASTVVAEVRPGLVDRVPEDSAVDGELTDEEAAGDPGAAEGEQI